MPETPSPAAHDDETAPSPSTVGNTFMRQYYHFLAKEPQSLHRFYKAESRWCHGVGSHMEEPIAGQRAINDQILKRGYAGARVDLDDGSIDCQNSLGGGVLVLVTGVMTLRSSLEPKPFVQTFFLAVQPKGYFVLNDCLRFLELPGASPNEEKQEKKEKKQETAAAAPLSPAKNGKKTETQAPTSPVKKVQEKKLEEETPVPASPKKVLSPVKTAKNETTTTKVVKETLTSPVKATATVASSPVKKTTTTTTTTTTTKPKEEVPAPAASPVKTASPAKSPVKSPKKQEKAASPAPADPVVAAPTEPEKPKTWAALFSAKTAAATIAPSAVAAAPASAPAKPSTPKAAAAPTSMPSPAAITPAAGAPAPEKSPKNKAGNGKEKEHKRLYSLFIRDVPTQTRDNEMRELFKGYGSIAGINVTGRGFAFVDYYEQESMRAALAETKEFKIFDKVLQVNERAERKEGQRGGFRGNDTRGRGRGHGPKGDRGDRKERNGEDTPAANKGNNQREGPRREKTGSRRGGKVDATTHNRPE